jgi:hypothetical protein
MTTEQPTNEREARDEHEARLHRVTSNLHTLANQLARQHPDFPIVSFAKAFLTVAISGLITAVGQPLTARYLRQLADGMDSEPERLN